MRRLAPITAYLLDPVARHLAGKVRGLAVLTHVGRRTGRRHRTPVFAFRRDDEYVIALGSGSDVQWVQNVVAAGHAELEMQGRTLRLDHPRLWTDPTMQILPRPLRLLGSMIGLTEFIALRDPDSPRRDR